MQASTVYKVSFAMAAIDLLAATVCAVCGDPQFMTFMVLTGLMWAHGLYFKTKAEKKGE
jgi:hypothetical protein